MNLQSELQQLHLELKNILITSRKYTATAPSGSLRTGRKKSLMKFYLYNPSSPDHGKYLGKKYYPLIQALVQKEYYEKTERYASNMLQALERFQKKYHPEELANIYARLSDAKKGYIQPFAYPSEDYARLWASHHRSEKNPYEIRGEIFSDRGEQVRSKSEKIIADRLFHLGIPYKYEEALSLDGRTIYPDFTVLNKRTRQVFYWEHFGMMDDPTYSMKAVEKILWYEKNDLWPGEQLLTTQESQETPLNMRIVEKMIHRYFM